MRTVIFEINVWINWKQILTDWQIYSIIKIWRNECSIGITDELASRTYLFIYISNIYLDLNLNGGGRLAKRYYWLKLKDDFFYGAIAGYIKERCGQNYVTVSPDPSKNWQLKGGERFTGKVNRSFLLDVLFLITNYFLILRILLLLS